MAAGRAEWRRSARIRRIRSRGTGRPGGRPGRRRRTLGRGAHRDVGRTHRRRRRRRRDRARRHTPGLVHTRIKEHRRGARKQPGRRGAAAAPQRRRRHCGYNIMGVTFPVVTTGTPGGWCEFHSSHSHSRLSGPPAKKQRKKLLPDEAHPDVERDQSGNRHEADVAVDRTDLEPQGQGTRGPGDC